MKKAIGIIILGLLWCNTSFANIDDLNIPITKAEVETEIIKPNKEYRQSCETGVTVEQSYIDIKFNSYIDAVGKKQTLVQEVTFDLGEDGNFIMKSQQKIKSDGTLSKVKASSDYIPGTTEVSKKEIKQAKKMFKTIAKYLDERAINYGEKLTLGIKREDAKKKMLKIIKDFEDVYLAAGENPKDVKEFIKILKKDSKFEMIKEYLGTTELNGEKFYAVRWDATLEYVGNITEMKETLEGLSYNSVYFIHAPSGYRSAVQMTMEEPDPSTEMYDDMICTIYKNDQMLTEVSISELEDKAVAKKTETKETTQTQQVAKKKEKKKTKQVAEKEPIQYFDGFACTNKKNNEKSNIILDFDKRKVYFDKDNSNNFFTSKIIWQRPKIILFKMNEENYYGYFDLIYKGIGKINAISAADARFYAGNLNPVGGYPVYAKCFATQIAKKEPKKETDDSNDIIQQLKDLNEMYKSGALTKEEFKKAKKKLLN